MTRPMAAMRDSCRGGLSALLLLVSLSQALGTPYRPAEPVIGVLSYPRHNASGSYIPSTYVQWLEQSGARVVAIPYDAPHDKLRDLFRQVNAVLFTGGPGKPLLAEAPYFQAATDLYQMVVESSRRGIVVPLWGTCLGLQTIACIAAGGKDVIGNFPVQAYAYPLSFTHEAQSSRLFGGLSPELRQDFGGNVTTNYHYYGVSPEILAAAAPHLVPLATNVALNGKAFVSALEGRDGLPIYAVQFHPESVLYDEGEWKEGIMVPPRSPAAIETVRYLADFFVTQARLNTQAFPSALAESRALIVQKATLKPVKVTSTVHLFAEGDYLLRPSSVPRVLKA